MIKKSSGGDIVDGLYYEINALKSKNEMLEKELQNKDLEMKQGNKHFEKVTVIIVNCEFDLVEIWNWNWFSF